MSVGSLCYIIIQGMFIELSFQMWCHENYLNFRNLSYAVEVRKQLVQLCQRCNIPIISCQQNLEPVRRWVNWMIFMLHGFLSFGITSEFVYIQILGKLHRSKKISLNTQNLFKKNLNCIPFFSGLNQNYIVPINCVK